MPSRRPNDIKKNSRDRRGSLGSPTSRKDTSNANVSAAESTQHKFLCANRPKVYVRVLRAQGFKLADAHVETLVSVRCRNATFRTSSIAYNSPTKWDETFEFGGVRNFLLDTDEVEICLIGKDVMAFTDEIGSVSIPLWSIKEDHGAHWYKLLTTQSRTTSNIIKDKRFPFFRKAPQSNGQDSNERIDAGEILVKVDYSEGNGPCLSRTLVSKDGTDTRELESQLSPKKDQYKGKVWFYNLRARVVSARNLQHKSDSVNSYAIIKCGASDEEYTRIVKNSPNPVWYEFFNFKDSAVPNVPGELPSFPNLFEAITFFSRLGSARHFNRGSTKCFQRG